MSTHSHHEILTRTVVYTVPAYGQWGATHTDFSVALYLARVAYRQEYGLEEDASIPDNAIRIKPGDDDIKISFDAPWKKDHE